MLEVNKLKVFSMFTGIGGFDLAFRNLGHEIVGACEIDKYARDIYSKHFPNVKIHHDATKMSPESLPPFDVLCAGFPCQTFSIAGKRAGFDDPRGNLFFEIARIAKEKRPRYLFLENVKGLLSHDQGETTVISIHWTMKSGKKLISPTYCKCCKKNIVDTSKGQQSHCDNCWDYMMGEGKDGLQWGDIWMLMCHWHSTHDEGDKDFDFAHDVILTAYSHKHYYRKDLKICEHGILGGDIKCGEERGHSGSHMYLWE